MQACLWLLLACLLSPGAALAQADAGPALPDYDGIVPALFSDFAKGDSKAAIKLITERALPGAQPEKITQVVEQVMSMTRSGGQYLGANQIVRQRFGPRYEKTVFLMAYERTLVRVELVFYRGKGDRWLLKSFSVNAGDDADRLLNDDAKSAGFIGASLGKTL